MIIDKMVNYFIQHPKQLSKSAGKFLRGEQGPKDVFKGCTVEDIYKAKAKAREILLNVKWFEESEFAEPTQTDDKKTFSEKVKDGTAEASFVCEEEIRNLEQLIQVSKIDTTKWEITRYVQNYWGNRDNPHWQVKVWLSVKKEENIFQEKFIE